MIKPTKHMNLNHSVIKITADVIKILGKQNIMEYTDLLNKLEMTYGEDVKYNFIPSLNLLYLLGKIKYHAKDDVFEMVTHET